MNPADLFLYFILALDLLIWLVLKPQKLFGMASLSVSPFYPVINNHKAFKFSAFKNVRICCRKLDGTGDGRREGTHG